MLYIGDIHFALALYIVGGIATAIVGNSAGFYQGSGALGVGEEGAHLAGERVLVRVQPALHGMENKGIAKADFARLFRRSGQLVLAQGRLDAEDVHGGEHGDVVAHGSGMVYAEIAGQGVVGGLSAGAADNGGQHFLQIVLLLAALEHIAAYPVAVGGEGGREDAVVAGHIVDGGEKAAVGEVGEKFLEQDSAPGSASGSRRRRGPNWIS